MTLFDFLNEITYQKSDWESFSEEDKKAWNSFMINRFLSMNPDYIEFVNIIQKYQYLTDKQVYTLYKHLIPKRKIFLKYIKGKKDKVDKNDLDSFKELDINFLDVDLLGDSLNFFLIDELSGDTKSMLANNLDKNLLPKYNEASGLKYYFNDDKSKVTLYRITTHTAFVTVGVEQDTMVNISQDGVKVQQMVNFGGTTSINIIQK